LNKTKGVNKMINRVVLIGRLTRDPELRYTTTGVAVCRFNVAVNRNYLNQHGEREADFINIVSWRGLAENCANYLRKGSLVGIDGRLQTGKYENKEGRIVYTTDVVAEDVRFLEPKKSKVSSTVPSDDPFGGEGDPFEGEGKQIDASKWDLPF
jgi:single-strand DNA-binding protein